MKTTFKRKSLVHFIYGMILFITCLSTLEQFSGLNEDIFKLPKTIFHTVTGMIALSVAIFEGYTMSGFDKIKSFFEPKEHVPDLPVEGRYEYRVIYLEEINAVYQLARKTYGTHYSFTEGILQSWWKANPYCFFGLFYAGELVGYIDAFPISANHYSHLIQGKNEKDILPESKDQLTPRSSFYIASFVVLPQHCNHVLKFVQKAVLFYDAHYPHKIWDKICAFAYTPKGLAWCKTKGMTQAAINTDIWLIDRETIPFLSTKNRNFWGKLLSGHPAPMTSA